MDGLEVLVSNLSAADYGDTKHLLFGAQRSEISDQRSDDFKIKDVGALIMLPSIAPTSRHFSVNIA
jgi:hypothetical protein